MTELGPRRRFIHHRIQTAVGFRKIPHQPGKRCGRSSIVLVLKLRLAEPENVLVGQFARLRFMRGEELDGLQKFRLFDVRLGLHQYRFGNAFGFGIFFGKLGEFHFRAAPHAVLKRAGGSGIGALFTRAGGKQLLATQHQRENDQRPNGAPKTCLNSKRRSGAKKARNARAASPPRLRFPKCHRLVSEPSLTKSGKCG